MYGPREIYRRGAGALGRLSPELSATELAAGTVIAIAIVAAIVLMLLIASS